MNSLREEIIKMLFEINDENFQRKELENTADLILTAVRQRVPKRRRRKRGMWYFDGWFDCRALLLEVLK